MKGRGRLGRAHRIVRQTWCLERHICIQWISGPPVNHSILVWGCLANCILQGKTPQDGSASPRSENGAHVINYICSHRAPPLEALYNVQDPSNELDLRDGKKGISLLFGSSIHEVWKLRMGSRWC